MLKIKNLEVVADGKTIISGLDLKVPAGEVHVIMGPNGIGKSTVCRTIMGDANYTVSSGTIEYNNEDITKLPPNERAKRGIFLLEQNPTSIPGVTNAEMLRVAQADRGIKQSIFEFNKKLSIACEDLHIEPSFIHHNINENMSGGEKKKNELLQIEILKPSLILLDELDSGLDVDSLRNLAMRLDVYRKENKASILVITHHKNILDFLPPDRVYILNDGKVAMEGGLELAEMIEKNGFKGAFSVGE